MHLIASLSSPYATTLTQRNGQRQRTELHRASSILNALRTLERVWLQLHCTQFRHRAPPNIRSPCVSDRDPKQPINMQGSMRSLDLIPHTNRTTLQNTLDFVGDDEEKVRAAECDLELY